MADDSDCGWLSTCQNRVWKRSQCWGEPPYHVSRCVTNFDGQPNIFPPGNLGGWSAIATLLHIPKIKRTCGATKTLVIAEQSVTDPFLELKKRERFGKPGQESSDPGQITVFCGQELLGNAREKAVDLGPVRNYGIELRCSRAIT